MGFYFRKVTNLAKQGVSFFLEGSLNNLVTGDYKRKFLEKFGREGCRGIEYGRREYGKR